MFGNMDSSNTLSSEFAERKRISQKTDIGWTVRVPTKTIDEILAIHLDYFQRTPFFMNIDIEGKDFDVIKPYSHDVRIPFIMLEDDSGHIFNGSQIRQYMESKGYTPIATTFLTTLYLDKDSKYFQHIGKIGMFDQMEDRLG